MSVIGIPLQISTAKWTPTSAPVALTWADASQGVISSDGYTASTPGDFMTACSDPVVNYPTVTPKALYFSRNGETASIYIGVGNGLIIEGTLTEMFGALISMDDEVGHVAYLMAPFAEEASDIIPITYSATDEFALVFDGVTATLYRNGTLLVSYTFTTPPVAIDRISLIISSNDPVNSVTLIPSPAFEIAGTTPFTGGGDIVETSSYPIPRNNLAFEISGLSMPLVSLKGMIDNGDIAVFNYSGDLAGVITRTMSSTADLPDTIGYRYVTDAQLATLDNTSGTNTGDQDLSGYEILTNKQSDLTASDTKYPTVNAVNTGLSLRQPRVVDVTTDTAGATSAKTATVEGYTPTPGDLIALTFTNSNTAGGLSLNINGLGPIPLRVAGGTVSANQVNGTGCVAFLYYDGVSYKLLGSQVNTTYSLIGTAEILEGTGTTGRSVSAQRLRYAFDNLLASSSASGTITASDKIKLDAITGTNTGDQFLFSRIAVSGQSDITAHTTGDTITLASGTGITITTDTSTDTITFSASGVTSTTGTLISFVAQTVYNTPLAPATGDITDYLIGAVIGIVQKIYHDDSSTPTFPVGWVKLGGGNYTTGTLNIIYCEWISDTRVEYWVTQ